MATGLNTRMRYAMIGLALAGSAFFGACTPNGGGSVNNAQNGQPAVEGKSGNLNNFSNVQEPAESPEKESQERANGQEEHEQSGEQESGQNSGQ